MSQPTTFRNATVEIIQSRYDVTVKITDEHGEEHALIASAGSALTWNDGIWFGTEQERDDALRSFG